MLARGGWQEPPGSPGVGGLRQASALLHIAAAGGA